MPIPQIKCLHTGKLFDYKIKDGIDLVLHLDMHHQWSIEKNSILRDALSTAAKVDPDVLVNQQKIYDLMISHNLADFNWDWLNKLATYKTDEHIWFYLIIDGSVQAICLLQHPKKSVLDDADIFYIHYIACAYTNRNRPNFKRRFGELGTILIKHTLSYVHKMFGYRLGCSLHAIPTAEKFYLKLKMTPLGKDPDHENLEHFEASEAVAIDLIGATI